jgi:hypothetical protein
MAHARQADRAIPQAASYLIAAMAAAILVTAFVAIAAFGLFNVQMPDLGGRSVDQAVLDSGAQWELERRAQSGYVDPVLESGDDWERQRDQQSGGSE